MVLSRPFWTWFKIMPQSHPWAYKEKLIGFAVITLHLRKRMSYLCCVYIYIYALMKPHFALEWCMRLACLFLQNSRNANISLVAASLAFPAIQGKDGKHTVAFILLMRECLICSWHRWGHKIQHCALIHNKPAKVREWELQAFLQLGCVCLDNITLHDIRLPLAFTALYAGSEIHVENYEDLANVERKAHGDWLIGAQGLAKVWHRSEAIAFAPIGLKWLFWRLHMTYVRTFEENAMQQQLKQMYKIVKKKTSLPNFESPAAQINIWFWAESYSLS